MAEGGIEAGGSGSEGTSSSAEGPRPMSGGEGVGCALGDARSAAPTGDELAERRGKLPPPGGAGA